MRRVVLLGLLTLTACGRAGLLGLLDDSGAGGDSSGSGAGGDTSQVGAGAGAGQGGSGGEGAAASQGGSGQGGSGQGGAAQGGAAQGGGLPSCGDGIVDPGEQCDDANASDDDDCVQGCLFAQCGDGFVRTGFEQCDDGNASDDDDCVQGCIGARCGDGFVRSGVEECDSGGVPSPTCDSSCKVPDCGDGVVGPGEACDLGALNANRYALAYRQGSGPSVSVKPYQRAQSATSFYNFFSNSGHTGFEAAGTSRIYFYRNTSNSILSLVIHHSIDRDTSQIATPQSFADFTLTGLPTSTFVALADDNGEFAKPFNDPTRARGQWGFVDNTDGGVLANWPIPGNWSVTLTSQWGGAPLVWEFMEGASQSFAPLDPTSNLVLEATSTPSQCRLDCSVPTCGDGILDGGEVCDEGPANGSVGCAADCASLLP